MTFAARKAGSGEGTPAAIEMVLQRNLDLGSLAFVELAAASEKAAAPARLTHQHCLNISSWTCVAIAFNLFSFPALGENECIKEWLQDAV